ncbi:hypothetical protein [Paenibacillus amylolyticus]|uniref:hypothetical protein n=1 Tax=Paenibacillus amylolyticus TaxID=1451 RepID=UPI0015C2D55F|nr:hypothetical protein [Paenibacillus amylolyticus]
MVNMHRKSNTSNIPLLQIKFFNTIRTLTTLVFLSTMLILSGCNPTPSHGANKTPSPSTTNAKEAKTELKQNQELPTPVIQTESGTPIPAIQGSYCWGGMCADYAGDMELLEGQVTVSVLVGENISIHLGTNVPPDELTLVEYVNGVARPISLREGSFQLAQEKGTHYYGAFARWTSSQNSQVSLGDTSFAFVIRGVEKK